MNCQRIEKVFKRVTVKPETKCWVWNGAVAGNGYGQTYKKGKVIYAHRLSYELFFGEVEKGLFVCHRCDNPPCVNPEHLFLGTNADNVDDRNKKGRTAKGEHCGLSKLTEKQVTKIRSLYIPIRGRYHNGKITKKTLASKFKVSEKNIEKILSNKTWKYV